MSGTLAGVTSLGSEVVLYVKIEWLPNGAQNVRFLAGFTLTCDWPDSEKGHRGRLGELRNGAKTKAGPLEAEQLSRLHVHV